MYMTPEEIREAFSNIVIGRGVKIERGVQIGSDVVIGSDVRIGSCAWIGSNAVIVVNQKGVTRALVINGICTTRTLIEKGVKL